MDGIHDFGGKEGYGPVDVNEPDVPFHADYEGRMWAISRLARPPHCTIDWWRHVREMIDPADYLTRSYFDSWAQTHLAAFIHSGVFTLDEVIKGTSATEKKACPDVIESVEQAVQRVKQQAVKFDREVEHTPLFEVGDTVLMALNMHSHHTRLPQYVRGKSGVIRAHHGAHFFPDLAAQGTEIPQHLYSVEFKACDLWPESKNSKDKVYLDLWESYFEAV